MAEVEEKDTRKPTDRKAQAIRMFKLSGSLEKDGDIAGMQKADALAHYLLGPSSQPELPKPAQKK